MNESKLLLSIFVAVEGAHAFSAFMPSYFTVKKFANRPEDLQSLRSGYVPAILFNAVLGGTVSYLTDSPYPLAFAFVVSLSMVLLYENAIRQVVTQ
jgi:hypothetical protein